MSELTKFLFDGIPVRGAFVRLDDTWQEILRRRASNNNVGAYPTAVRQLLGEMTAAGLLMQSSIQFNGALVLQITGDGPVKLAVTEVQSNLQVRSTASVLGTIAENAQFDDLVNLNGAGRCVITLDPAQKFEGQQTYQGIVSLFDEKQQKLQNLSHVLEHYMRQSEQLETTLVLAANDSVAAGLLIQRMPTQGGQNLAGDNLPQNSAHPLENTVEDYQRIAILASSLKPEELLTLDAETILHRLFWQEPIRLFSSDKEQKPKFGCNCSHERVVSMIRSLGQAEANSIIEEQSLIEVGCEFCGKQYKFDAIDTAQIFKEPSQATPQSEQLQ